MTVTDPNPNPAQQETPPAEEPTGLPVPTEPPPPPPPPETTPAKKDNDHGGKTFTAEDIEKVRKEEKDKLYKGMEDLKSQLAALTKEREDREKALKEQAKKAEDEAKKKAEDEMSAKELLAQKEQEWEQRFHTIEQNRERSEALLEQEKRFSALMDFRARRVAEEAEDIMPELIDYITGTDENEIEASIAAAKEKTAKVIANFQSAAQQHRQQMPGTKVTTPPVGPMENQPGYETLTADDIRGMDMATYAKRRQQLLGAASENRNKGLFG